jgi:septum formation protein
MRLVLASASPRRAELLTAAGFSFEVVASDVDETPLLNELPGEYAVRVAREKAAAAAGGHASSAILAADTVVIVQGEILGKPDSAADAVRMLSRLSGIEHIVATGVVLRLDGRDVCELESTRVRFLPMTADEIAWYVGTGESEGKAGGYAIQGRAARFIDRIEGSWSNVVGLPIATVYRLLKDAGIT